MTTARRRVAGVEVEEEEERRSTAKLVDDGLLCGRLDELSWELNGKVVETERTDSNVLESR